MYKFIDFRGNSCKNQDQFSDFWFCFYKSWVHFWNFKIQIFEINKVIGMWRNEKNTSKVQELHSYNCVCFLLYDIYYIRNKIWKSLCQAIKRKNRCMRDAYSDSKIYKLKIFFLKKTYVMYSRRNGGWKRIVLKVV